MAGRRQIWLNGLNKAVSTISGYESDAHAIPLDVLASISSLFSISTDELLGLDAPEVLSLSGLTGAQKKTLIKLRNELLSPSQKGMIFPHSRWKFFMT